MRIASELPSPSGKIMNMRLQILPVHAHVKQRLDRHIKSIGVYVIHQINQYPLRTAMS